MISAKMGRVPHGEHSFQIQFLQVCKFVCVCLIGHSVQANLMFTQKTGKGGGLLHTCMNTTTERTDQQ
jgi:hypothetical protein